MRFPPGRSQNQSPSSDVVTLVNTSALVIRRVRKVNCSISGTVTACGSEQPIRAKNQPASQAGRKTLRLGGGAETGAAASRFAGDGEADLSRSKRQRSAHVTGSLTPESSSLLYLRCIFNPPPFPLTPSAPLLISGPSLRQLSGATTSTFPQLCGEPTTTSDTSFVLLGNKDRSAAAAAAAAAAVSKMTRDCVSDAFPGKNVDDSGHGLHVHAHEKNTRLWWKLQADVPSVKENQDGDELGEKQIKL